MELTIQVLYNGKNEGDILDQYVSFTEKVDDLYKEYGRTKEAAEKLLEYCMENDILPGISAGEKRGGERNDGCDL